VAKHPAVEADEALVLLLLKVFKILSRKQENRESIGAVGIRCIVRFLRDPASNRVAAEVRCTPAAACAAPQPVPSRRTFLAATSKAD
jgi:hypothetical protein